MNELIIGTLLNNIAIYDIYFLDIFHFWFSFISEKEEYVCGFSLFLNLRLYLGQLRHWITTVETRDCFIKSIISLMEYIRACILRSLCKKYKSRTLRGNF